MKRIISVCLTWICTKISLFKIKHGNGCKCNFPCSFTVNTVIGDNCHFNGMKVSGSGKIMIGNNFHSGKYCRILTSFHNYDKGSCIPYDDTMISKDVIIEDNVWIGEHVYVLGGVTIGEGAVIQAGSVVCTDVPPLSIAGGHPAKAFKKRDEAHYYKLKNEKKFM